jgi:hypothetical protein
MNLSMDDTLIHIRAEGWKDAKVGWKPELCTA